MPEIIVAKLAGFCFGVQRALRLAEMALERGGESIYAFGALIHNPQAVNKLEARGLKTISSLTEVKSGRVIVRSHGAPPEFYQDAREKGLEVVDATCPLVKRAQKAAALLKREGYRVVLIGEEDHPEVHGIKGYSGEGTLVFQDVRALGHQKLGRKVGLVIQTTQPMEAFHQAAQTLLERVAGELRIFNTLCPFTLSRQREAEELAGRVEVILVVGGRNSANTARLRELCLLRQSATFLIETADELKREWLEGKEKIGIATGASTPPWIIEEVQRKVQGFLNLGS